MPPRRPPGKPTFSARPARAYGSRGGGTDSNRPSGPAKAGPRPGPAPAGKGEEGTGGSSYLTRSGETLTLSGWRRRVAEQLDERGLRWRYRAFDFPLVTKAGKEVTWTPDFFIYDEAPKLVRVIVVPGPRIEVAREKAALFKAQYRAIAVEVWDAARLKQLGLL